MTDTILLGHGEGVLVAAMTLVTLLTRRGSGGLLGPLTRRLQPEARIAALHARRLDAAASDAFEAIVDAVDPGLILSLQPEQKGELPLLSAAYRRRTPVVALALTKRSLRSFSMPAARFARLVVADGRLAALALRRGAHPFRRSTGSRSRPERSRRFTLASTPRDSIHASRTPPMRMRCASDTETETGPC